ncbi:type I-B CRISPR-associated protein Cas7/Csh2 [Synergistales bacterium]|nr:type I-B CRISPR-associated protein Cas7/Csh2 [Synergistales bacterium]
MAFKNRREILFVYSVKDANPNGDPLNANHPRFDDSSGQILVSDVRVKRTVRDQWLREGRDVFVDGESKTLAARVEELKKTLGVQSGKDALAKCIDTKLFGVTFALGKESFAWTGPVQFKWGRSLHKAEVAMVQGTAAFATKETSEQRSFRSEYIVPFVVIGDYAIANQYASKTTGATDEDLDLLFGAIWQGTTNLITRSKVGHAPRLLMEIKYRDGFDGIIGSLDEKIAIIGNDGHILSSDEQRSLRSCGDFSMDISRLTESVGRVKADVEAVKLWLSPELNITNRSDLEKILEGKLKLEAR